MTMTQSGKVPPKIRLSNVCKAFGPKAVLKGLDLTILAGESVVIIGGSGTGKSVTLKCILGLLKPDTGSIEIDGANVDTIDKERAFRWVVQTRQKGEEGRFSTACAPEYSSCTRGD